MFPLIALGIASTLGSMFANSQAQSSVNDARGRVNAAERARQRVLDAEATKINTGAQDRYQDFQTKQQTKSAELGDYFKQPVATAAPVALPPTSSNVVTREIARKEGEARAFGDQQADALGNLRSFGDLLGSISRGQARDASLVDQIGGFKKGSASVVPLELEEANAEGGGAKLLGDLLSGVGKIGLTAGLSGGLGGMFAANPVASSATAATAWPTSAAPIQPWPTYASSPTPAAYLKF